MISGGDHWVFMWDNGPVHTAKVTEISASEDADNGLASQFSRSKPNGDCLRTVNKQGVSKQTSILLC